MNDNDQIPVLTALRGELVEGVRQSNQRRATQRPVRRVAAVGMAAAAVAAAVSLVVAVGPGDTTGPAPAAAFSVQVEDDGRIHVQMHNDMDQARELEEELRAAGIDVAVIPIKSHPMLAGMYEFPSHQLEDQGVERGEREFWIDPQQFDGQVDLIVYEAPEPGEDWVQAPSAFHPDEPLGGLPCALDGPLTTEDLERRARAVSIDEFTWMVYDPEASSIDDDGVVQTDRITETDTFTSGQVIHAQRIGPDHLQVHVAPTELVERDGPLPRPLSMNLNLHDSPEPECTPELRARWTG